MPVDTHMPCPINWPPGSPGGQSRLDVKVGAVTIELTANDFRAIEAAAAQIQIEGAHYPDKLEAQTGR